MDSASQNRLGQTNQRGQSIVEISLITPLLLVALYIPFDFGIAMFMGNLTQNAAREGARIGSGLQKTGGSSAPFTFNSTEAVVVKNEVFNRMPAFVKNKTVTVNFYEGSTCMEFIEVTANGEYNFFLYQLLRLFGGNVPNSALISRTTQIRYNYQPYDNTSPCSTPTSFGPYTS